jgi:hypothetical protein
MPPAKKLDPRLKKALGRVSGMDDDAMESIAQEVKDNSDRLNGCACHQFVIDETGTRHGISFRYRCTVCRGIIDQSAWFWYNRGRTDAAKAVSVRALEAHDFPAAPTEERTTLILKKKARTTAPVGYSPHIGR